MNFDLPTLVLALLFFLGIFVMWKAQTRDGFDFSNMLRDENMKESAVRLGILVSLAVSSWVVVFNTMKGILGYHELFLYLFTWSGVALFSKMIDKWDGHGPWSKHGADKP